MRDLTEHHKVGTLPTADSSRSAPRDPHRVLLIFRMIFLREIAPQQNCGVTITNRAAKEL
jgi:hypothetical protein